jgi:hypothetical protein
LDFGAGVYGINGEGVSLADAVTYSRASSASYLETYRGPLGREQERITTDYVGSVTNLFTYSEQFDNAVWVTTALTKTKTSDKNSDGLNSAYKLTPTETSSAHFVSTSPLSFTAGVTYSTSVIAKASGYQFLQLTYSSSGHGPSQFANFDLIGGTITNQLGGVASIKYLNNGWYECTWTATATITATSSSLITIVPSSNSVRVATYLGNTSDSILIHKAQVTASAKPLPYVKTLDTEVTQAFTAKPRIEKQGYLSEGASTNLVLRSEDFDNAYWSKQTVTITPNAALAPDGSFSADLFSTVGGVFPQIFCQATTVVSGAVYTCSLWVKAASTTPIQHTLIFNGVLTQAFTPAQEWQRIVLTGISPDTLGSVVISQNSATAVAASFYIWGAQLELGGFATSYIRTDASAVSRAADVMNAPINFTSGNFTIEAQGLGAPAGVYDTVGSLAISSVTYAEIRSAGNTGRAAFSMVINSSVQVENISASVDFLSNTKVSINININDVNVFYGDNEIINDTNSNVINFTILTIGNVVGGGTSFYGHIKRCEVYDTALTASEVKSL